MFAKVILLLSPLVTCTLTSVIPQDMKRALECPAVDGLFPVFFPHPTDCNLYYECSTGHPWLNNCPPDLHWSTTLNTCTFQEDAGCQVQKEFKTRRAVERAPQCPEVDGDEPVYFPHETDCSLYYECSNGLAWLNNCPPELHWSPTLTTCTLPAEAGCTI